MNEAMKGKFIKEWEQEAADAYSKIITRYPISPRAEDAKKHLAELKRPIPTPTPEAIAQNKAEEESREKLGIWSRAMLNFHRHPDMAEAAGVGEPTLVDPKQTDAPEMMKHVNAMIMGGGTTPSGTVNVETGTGPIGPNQPPPRSDQPAAQPQGENAAPAAQPSTTSTPSDSTAAAPDQSPAATGIGELTPMNSAPGTTATQTTPQQANPAATEPTGTTTAPAPAQGGTTAPAPVAAPDNAAAGSSNAPAAPPAQVNEINNTGTANGSTTNGAAAGTSSSKDQSSDDSKDQKESSSKKKKKKFKVF
jgi:outer membrane protein assembly factor BamD